MIWPTTGKQQTGQPQAVPSVLYFLAKEAPCECHVFRLQREVIEIGPTFHLRASSRSGRAPATCLIAFELGGYIRGCHHSASRSASEPPLNEHSPCPRSFYRWCAPSLGPVRAKCRRRCRLLDDLPRQRTPSSLSCRSRAAHMAKELPSRGARWPFDTSARHCHGSLGQRTPRCRWRRPRTTSVIALPRAVRSIRYVHF